MRNIADGGAEMDDRERRAEMQDKRQQTIIVILVHDDDFEILEGLRPETL